MTSLLGWLDTRGGADGAGRAATLSAATRAQTVTVGANASLRGGPDASIAEDPARGCAALLRGQPRWLDATLADIARRQSHARALLEGYLSLGERVAERLAGTFAFAVIDGRRQRAVLAIDRMGVERLCYGFN